jgi:uracil-DNA glycosylase
MQQTIANLLALLAVAPAGPGVFNPWFEIDPDHDLGQESPEIRRRQLTAYLNERRKSARYLVIGEALGYQGGHFSGIAMTSERLLLGHLAAKGLRPEHVLETVAPARTSRPEVKPLGFNEPTATVAWGTLLQLGLGPREFVIWNTFAWHPYNSQVGRLTNRRPTPAELAFGYAALVTLLQIFEQCTVIAVGKVAAEQLRATVEEVHEVRHPANGGVPAFRAGLAALFAHR